MMSTSVSAPGRKLVDLVKDCLTYRGFSEGEADNMINRIMTYGGDADVEWEPILPFGKYSGWNIADVPRQYIAWLGSQSWVASKHPQLYAAVLKKLGYSQ